MTAAAAHLPASRVPDPRAAPTLRWGVLGTGWIAGRFVAALQEETTQQVGAVGSRTPGSARAFADRFAIPTAHGSYAELVADPAIDVIYVATPHNRHLEHATLALEAGKHVVVEKPLALNAEQARQLAGIAAATGRFCMEAMWTFFLPKFDVLSQVIADGMLGQVRSVVADFGEAFPPEHRILRPELAGGPMLDLGTYPIALALAVLGTPETVRALGTPAPTGVNGQVGILLRHGADGQSVIHSTVFSDTPTVALIAGTEATVTVAGIFYRPGPFRVDFFDDRPPLHYDEPRSGYAGLAFEAAEAARRIAAGERESPIRPLEDSIATLATMDEVRRQIGATFDEERSPGAP